jgi:CDP-glucose 4,6-dehydratase
MAGLAEPWAERRVFVTGATGMIGSWLVRELLSHRAEVTALVRDADPRSDLFRSRAIERISVVTGALEDYWTLERAITEYQVDTVFHLGAQTLVTVAHESPLATFESNIRGTYNLLEACRRHAATVRAVIMASSDKAYGEQENLPYTEDMPLRGQHPYEVSKSCADLLAQGYYRTYDLPIAIARCGNVYGGGDLNWSRIVPGTVRSLLMRQEPVIRSDGTYKRDYIYARDIVLAYIRLAEAVHAGQTVGHAFNFSPERPLTVSEMVTAIQEVMDCTDVRPRILNCAVGEIHSQWLSAAKARDMLGWRPTYSLQAGLAETVEWYRELLLERT